MTSLYVIRYLLGNMTAGLKRLQRHEVTYDIEGSETSNTTGLISEYIDPDPVKTNVIFDADYRTLTIAITATIGETSIQKDYQVTCRPGS